LFTSSTSSLRRSFLLLCAVFALHATTQAHAQPAPQRITSVEGITEYRLANGLKVLLFPDNSKPTITVNVTYLVGSRHENYGETGMAHLLEHLLFKGTPTNPDIPKQFSQRSARFNGTTNFDRTNYFELFPASEDNLKWAIELEADRMVNSNIAQKDLDSEMSVVRNEYERGENSPGGVLGKRMHSVAYDWHNYQNSPIGNRSDIENVKIENLQAFYRQYYQPDNAVLLVAGKIDEAKTLALVNATFGKIPKPTRVLPKLWTVEPTQDGERSFTVRRSGNIQLVMVAYKIPGVVHQDALVLSFMSGILGGAPSGRLHKLLVESGKAVGVSVGGASTVDPGLFMANAAVKEGESVEDVQKLLIETLENFHSKPATAEEMSRVLVEFDKQYDQFLSSPETMAISMSESIARGDWRLSFYLREQVKKVTVADISRVAKTYLKRDNRTVGLFLPATETQRAEIPVAPVAADVLKNFNPSLTMVAGEDFDPSPANIDARTVRYTLSNGAKVALLAKKTRGETVNVTIRGHSGTLETVTGRSFAAAIASSLTSTGTSRYTRAQLQDEKNKLKISGSAGTASASFRTTKPNLVASLELMAHNMREPVYPETEVEQFRKLVLTSLESSKSDPGALANEAISRHFNGYKRGDPRYVSSREESIEDIKALNIDQLKQAHKDFGGFSNAEIVVVGDFDEKEIRPLLEKLFGNWNSTLPYKRIENPYREVAPINKTIETPDKENAVFRAQMLFEMNQEDKDYAALTLANYIFGGGAGLNARIAKRIRGKEGLSYGANTSLGIPDFDRRSVFSVSATAAPQNIAKLETIFREELDLARRDGFTAEELANAKSGTLGSRSQQRAQDSYLASSWADRMHRGKTFAEAAEFDAKFQAVTLEEVNAAFRKHIDPAKLTIVKAGDFAKAAKADATK
jgi:zinc protease